MILSCEIVRELFEYDPDDGILRRRKSKGAVNTEDGAGTSTIKSRYYTVKIDGKSYLVHRVIWLWVTGSWPDEIDHVDRNGLNNKWNNLRIATHSENLRNTKMYSSNATGVKGTNINNGKYRVRITVNGARLHIGYFNSVEGAAEARKRAQELHFGKFAGPCLTAKI